MNLRLLRDETWAQHEATEALLPLNDPELDLQRYQQVLQCFYAFVSRWEAWATTHVPAKLSQLLEGRRRSGLLERDFSFFGATTITRVPCSGSSLDQVVSGINKDSAEYEAAFLGSMYVIEGSTLGGQYIARHVEQNLNLTPGEGDAYFRGYGDQTMTMWAEFRQLLEAIPEEHSARVIGAARVTFDFVQDILRSCPAATTGRAHHSSESDLTARA